MEIKDAIYGRRSIRRYTSEKVPKETIYQIIEAGTWAPSACNVQGWRFIIIDDKTKLDQICEKGAASFLKNVNQAILVLYDNQSDNLMYSDYIQSAAACIENMLLMAQSLNIGTCWINFLPPKEKLRKIFNIPKTYDPIALVSLGFYDSQINMRERKYSLEDLICENEFKGVVTNSIVKKPYKLMIKRLMRKVYFWFPQKELLDKLLSKHEKKFDN